MRRFAVIVAAISACLATLAHADERISDFNSDIRISQTGALTVTETISVNSEGEQIRHGIYRDFPTTYTDTLGRRVHVGFDVLSVTLDGHTEPYSVAAIEDGQRVKIGDPNNELPPGPHRFTLTYATDRQIGFFSTYDELYWNVTGNFWQFPIDHAETTVALPAGAHIIQDAVYTGAAGSTEQNAKARATSDSTISFETTAPLGSREGLTVAVGFSKGAVLPPTPAELRRAFLRDNSSALVACLGVLALVIYFLVAWFEHARHPKRGVIIPLFVPPRDFSPAAVRFVHRMAYDRKSYAASLVDMAVKGYLKITEADHTYTIARTGTSEAAAGLAHGETQIGYKLFASRTSIELTQTHYSIIQQSISALRTSLTSEYERVYFVTNSHWFYGGMAILAVTAVMSALLCDDPAPAGFILVWLTGWSVGVAILLHRGWDAWAVALAGPGSRILNTLGALFVSAFALPFVAGWFIGVAFLARTIPLPTALALTFGGIVAYLFYNWLKTPTLAGAKIYDQIDGFRLFLVTAEKDRLEALSPPEVTPEVFEKYLPYAIALDCENQWSRKFEAQAAAAGMTPDAAGNYYTPNWYSGGAFDRLGTAGFADSLGSSMAAAAASAATAPGSSSGSGGGGSSGGGGGGGGGGGW
ncbi:MAG TPA: DUF2207 domain-containing protein [Rhizomicrobium sp.]